MHASEIALTPPRRGLFDVTDRVRAIVADARVGLGLCHLFVQHTSCSLLIQENADPDVLLDLEDWMSRAVPDGGGRYRHADEGPDDMPGHIRSMLTATSLTVPIRDGRLALGRWQAIYLYEHRYSPAERRILVTVQG